MFIGFTRSKNLILCIYNKHQRLIHVNKQHSFYKDTDKNDLIFHCLILQSIFKVHFSKYIYYISENTTFFVFLTKKMKNKKL